MIMGAEENSIVFPREWEYRVFCEAGKVDAAEEEFRKIAAGEKLDPQMQRGESSKNGTYSTVRITVVVASKEQVEIFGKQLKDVDGVKFIL